MHKQGECGKESVHILTKFRKCLPTKLTSAADYRADHTWCYSWCLRQLLPRIRTAIEKLLQHYQVLQEEPSDLGILSRFSFEISWKQLCQWVILPKEGLNPGYSPIAGSTVVFFLDAGVSLES